MHKLSIVTVIRVVDSMPRFKWSMRVIAFLLMFVLGIMNLVCNIVTVGRTH